MRNISSPNCMSIPKLLMAPLMQVSRTSCSSGLPWFLFLMCQPCMFRVIFAIFLKSWFAFVSQITLSEHWFWVQEVTSCKICHEIPWTPPVGGLSTASKHSLGWLPRFLENICSSLSIFSHFLHFRSKFNQFPSISEFNQIIKNLCDKHQFVLHSPRISANK